MVYTPPGILSYNKNFYKPEQYKTEYMYFTVSINFFSPEPSILQVPDYLNIFEDYQCTIYCTSSIDQ